MGTRQFITFTELEDLVNDPNFFHENDSDAEIDIVELISEKVDVIFDTEDINKNVSEDIEPKDVPGRV